MDISADSEQFGSFGGSGWKQAVVGNKSASGSISGKQNFLDVIHAHAYVDRSMTLKLYETTTDSGSAADAFWSVTAKVTGLSPNTDADGGGAVGWSVTWVSDGAVVWNGGQSPAV
jgi:hypothetical protein